MPNFFTDNSDLLYQFNRLDLDEIVRLTEDNFNQAKDFNYAPINYEDALENYKNILEVVGDIAGNFIAPRAASVDDDGASFSEGKVKYAKGTKDRFLFSG